MESCSRSVGINSGLTTYPDCQYFYFKKESDKKFMPNEVIESISYTNNVLMTFFLEYSMTLAL